MIDIIKKIIDTLDESISPKLKRPFYYGDPAVIPASMLPTIAVELTSSGISNGPTGFDRHIDTITIKVIVDKRVDFNKPAGEVVAHKTLVDFVKGVDSSGNLKSDSVLGVLRKNISLDSEALDQLADIDFSVIKREDIVTEEAWITFSVESIVEVENRT